MTDDGCVYLKIGDIIINLAGEIGTTYVSFMAEQDTTSEQKETALSNIGFIYDTMPSIDDNIIQNGIIYVSDQQKLYTILNGTISEFTIPFPNPFTEQFVIQKNDAKEGALVIMGTGKQNSLKFNNFWIYDEDGKFVLDTDGGDIYFNVGGINKFKITQNTAVFTVPVTGEKFQSPNATRNYGFRLFMSNGESYLEVDHLYVRFPDDSDIPNDLYPYYWYYKSNLILSAEESEIIDDGGEDDNIDYSTVTYTLNLAFPNEFVTGQILYVYVPVKLGQSDYYQWLLLPLQVIDNAEEEDEGELSEEEQEYVNGLNTVCTVSILMDKLKEEDSALLEQVTDLMSIFSNQIVFLVAGEVIPLLRRHENNLDLIESESVEDAVSNDKLVVRIGNLTELGFEGREGPIEGQGLYAKQSAFLQAQYNVDYDLPLEDDTTKFASTEWVNDLFDARLGDQFDLTFNDKSVDAKSYFSSLTGLQDLIAKQDPGTKQGYVEQYGVLTIDLSVTPNVYSVIAKAKTEDDDWSYRVLTVDSNYKVLGNYIIKDIFNPGYYYSSSATDNKPDDPVYLGTDKKDFQTDKEKPYLWYTNDGKKWDLIEQYIDPDPNYYYICTTAYNSYYSIQRMTPGGFVCYCDSAGTTKAIKEARGKSAFMAVEDVAIDPPAQLDLLTNITTLASKGKMPRMSGFGWVFELTDESKPTEPASWKLLNNAGTGGGTQSDYNNLSISNCGGVQANVTWNKVNDDQTIVEGDQSASQYLTGGIGTPENWAKDTFVNAFLISAFSQFLEKNQHRYSPNLGWQFTYQDGHIWLRGQNGFIHFKCGMNKAPTEDPPEGSSEDKAEYYSSATFHYVSGRVIWREDVAEFWADEVHPGFQIPYGQFYTSGTDSTEPLVPANKKAPYPLHYGISYKNFKYRTYKLDQSTEQTHVLFK